MEMVSSVLAIIAIIMSAIALTTPGPVGPAGPSGSTVIPPALETRLKALESTIGPVDLELVKGAVKEGAVTWYTSMPDWQATWIAAEWAKIYPEIKLSWWRSGSEAVISKYLVEIEAGKILCDVIAASSPTGFVKLINKTALEAYKPPEYDYYPFNFKHPDGYWVTPRVITDLFWYNVQQVQDPPKSWWDLTDPKWKGKIVLGSPSTSGSALATLASTVRDSRLGWDFWEALIANDVIIVDQHIEAARMVSAGERLIGVCSWGYTANYPLYPTGTIGVVVPTEGLICFDHSVGLVANRPHSNAGKLFIRFMLSAHVAAYIARDDYCPRLDVPAPLGRPSLSQLPTLAFPADWLAKNQEQLINDFRNLLPTG